jgi:hypothetical protein
MVVVLAIVMLLGKPASGGFCATCPPSRETTEPPTRAPAPNPTAPPAPRPTTSNPTTNQPTTRAPTTSSPTRKALREKCLVACECGTRTDDSSELTCSTITSRLGSLAQAVETATCDVLNPPILPVGTFSSLAVDCIVNLGTSRYDMDEDVARALKAVAETVGNLRASSSSPLLEAAFARIRAVVSAARIPEGTALPGWSIGFWKSRNGVDINLNSKATLFDDAARVLDQFSKFQASVYGWGAQVAESTADNQDIWFTSIHNSATIMADVGSDEVQKSVLDVDEYLGSARDSVARLTESGSKLLGSRGSGEGLLGQLSHDIADLRNKTILKQQADLAAARQAAFIDFFKLAFEFGSMLVGGIQPAIRALKGVWQLGGSGKEAVKGVYKSLRSGMGFRAAFKSNSEAFRNVKDQAGQVHGNASIVIEHATAVSAKYNAYTTSGDTVDTLLQDVRQGKESFEDVDNALSRMRGLLDTLVTRSEAMTETLLRASEWVIDINNTSIEDTVVDASLLQSAQLWASTASRIIFMLTTELGVCPSQGETNPFADRRRRLTSAAPAHLRPELSLQGRDASATQTTPTELRRALDGKKDAADANAAARDAWYSNTRTCAIFMQELNEYAGWGAAAQGELFSAVRGIRNLIVVKRRVEANKRVINDYEGNKVKAMAQQQSPPACEGRADVDKLRCKKSLFLAETNAGFAVSGGLLESRMIATIEAFCKSYAYARPSSDVKSALSFPPAKSGDGSGTGAAVYAELDGTLCRVTVGIKDVKVGDSQCSRWPDRILALKALLETAWSAGFRNMLRDEKGTGFLRLQNQCQLRSPSFLRALFPDSSRWAKGASATFEVRLPSFGRPNCYPAAEMDSFIVVFRDAAGAIVPRPPGSVSYGITKLNNTAGFKYSMSSFYPTVLTEYVYLTSGSKTRLMQYKVATGQCTGFQAGYRPFKLNKTAIDSATELCIPTEVAEGGDDLQIRPPLYGRWTLSLDAWPDNEPMPASVEIHADVIAQNNCAADVKSDEVRIVYSAERTALDYLDANALLQGAEVCGGVDFNNGAQQDDLLVGLPAPLPGKPPAGSTRSSSVTTIIAGAAAGALIVAAAVVAARSRRQRQLGASGRGAMLASVGAENPVFTGARC